MIALLGGLQGVHYVVDPTGWGVQLDVPMETARTMPGCENPHQVRSAVP
jgi:hypothetical protein